jgi:hypothetical protein
MQIAVEERMDVGVREQISGTERRIIYLFSRLMFIMEVGYT